MFSCERQRRNGNSFWKKERTKKEKAKDSRMNFPALFSGCHFGPRGNLGSVLQMTMQNGGSETKKSSSIIQAQKQVWRRDSCCSFLFGRKGIPMHKFWRGGEVFTLYLERYTPRNFDTASLRLKLQPLTWYCHRIWEADWHNLNISFYAERAYSLLHCGFA